MLYAENYKITILYNFMLFINLIAIYSETDNRKNLLVTDVLSKSCRKNLSQEQNKKDQVSIEILASDKMACESLNFQTSEVNA